MKRSYRLHNIFNIMVLTFVLTFGATVLVMAEDTAPEAPSQDGDSVVVETVVEESGSSEEETPAVEPADETPAEDVPSEETPVVDPADEVAVTEPADEAPVAEPVDEAPAEETSAVEIPADVSSNEEVVVEEIIAPADEEEEGELGPASFYDPATGTTTIYYPDGTVEVIADAPETIEEEGVLGPASFYDAETGITSVYYPDGTTESYEDNSDVYYSTASVAGDSAYTESPILSSDIPVQTVEAKTSVEEETEEVGFIAPADAEDGTEVLGAYAGTAFSAVAAIITLTALAAISLLLFALKRRKSENA